MTAPVDRNRNEAAAAGNRLIPHRHDKVYFGVHAGSEVFRTGDRRIDFGILSTDRQFP